MDQTRVLIRGDIQLPKKSYLVFLFSDGEVKVVHSSSIEYLGENQEEFRFKEVVGENILDVDPDHMELSIDNALVNNVRWFEVHKTSDDKWKIKAKKYESKVSFANYLASIFTLGIAGCVILRRKGKEIERLAKNWDRAQQELCKWEFLGKEVSGLLEGQEWDSWFSDVSSISKYGEWTSIKEILSLGNKVKQILGINHADEVDNALKNYQDKSTSFSSADQQIIDRLTAIWGEDLNDLVSHLDGWRRMVPLNQMEERLELWDRVSRMFGVRGIDEFQNIQLEYERLKLEGSKLQDVIREKDEWRSRHLLLNQELKDLAETEEERKIVKKLRYWGGEWSNLDQGLENLKKYGDLDSVREKLESFSQISELLGVSNLRQAEELKNKLKSMDNTSKLQTENSFSEDSRVISSLASFCDGDLHALDREVGHLVNKYGSLGSLDEKVISLEKELGDLINTDDDKRIIRRFQNDGGLVQLERDLNDLREYGSYDSIKYQLDFGKKVSQLFGSSDIDSLTKIKNETLEQIPKLQQKIKDLEEREKRWQSLTSSGQSLEYLEGKRKENEGKTNKGVELERQIEGILIEMDNWGVDDNFLWKKQHVVEGTKADFFVEVKNKHSQNLKVVLECKRYGNYGDELGYLSSQDMEDDVAAKKRLIDQGIKQLCDYYYKNDAGVGLLVTDIDLRSIGKQDLISRIRRDDVPEKYRGRDDMNLLLVHVSCFRTLMIVIRFVMNVCSPDVEISWENEQMKKLHNAPDVQSFIKEVIDWSNAREKLITQMKKRFETINKTSSRGQKDCVKYDEVDKKLQECVDKLQINHNTYSNAPLQLEGTDEGVVLEEETLLESGSENE